MKRRDVIKSGLAASVIGAVNLPGEAATSAEESHYYELRTYDLRNDLKPARIQDFFQNHYTPMAKRLGLGPVGFFSVVAGQNSPALLMVIDHKSLAEIQTTRERVFSDKEFIKALQEFDAAGELPYVRYESTLLRAFDAHPKIEIPPADDKRPLRLYELRTYESKNSLSIRNKMEMFNQEEVKIFRDCGFAPVFFGEAIFGSRLPHLTYMVGFDNMVAREKAWDTFRANPDWVRIRNKPGWTDPEAVTNIQASFLRPTNYSQIR